MDAAFIDDEWRGRISSRANSLDHCNPFAITWLNKLRPSTSLRASYDFHSPNHSHLKACFVEVVDVILIDTKFSYCLTYKRELSANNLGIFLEYSLPILRSIEYHFELI
jgi:hypothetical protein